MNFHRVSASKYDSQLKQLAEVTNYVKELERRIGVAATSIIIAQCEISEPGGRLS